MTIASAVQELTMLPDCSLYRGASASEIFAMEGARALPSDHRDFLRLSNGIEVYSGYFRLFGVGRSGRIDLAEWNEFEHWMFAWGQRCVGFFCFGESAWGDQYAYSFASDHFREVYLLDAISMEPQIIADSFNDFLHDEFLRCAKAPYDEMITAAWSGLGPIGPSDNLVYVPSLLLGGTEAVESIQAVPARVGMIINGDIATQIDACEGATVVTGIEPYEDGMHRPRLRLIMG